MRFLSLGYRSLYLGRSVVSFVALSALLCASGASAFDADSDSIIDEADAFPCKADSSSVIFTPGQGQHGLLLIEDQWPSRGDLDFNDAVVSYNYIFELNPAGQVLSLRATYNLLALGGIFNNGMGLHIPIQKTSVKSVRLTVGDSPTTELTPAAADRELTVQLLENMRQAYGNLAGTINSDPSRAPVTAGLPLEVEITFAAPVTLDTSQAPFDLYIFRTEAPTHEIHRPEFSGTAAMDQSLFQSDNDGSTLQRHYVDTDGLPFVLNLPGLYPWSREGDSIEHLYPNIIQFAASGGAQARDFYANGVDLHHAYGWTPIPSDSDPTGQYSVYSCPVPRRFIGPDSIPADTACVKAWDLSVTYGTSRDTFGYDSVSDSAGNIIVTGYTTRTFTGNSNQGGQDAFVAKFDRSGTLLWSRQFGGAGNDAGRSVAVDSAGNIYVAGETRSSFDSQTNAGQNDAFVTKLSTNGQPQWTRLVGGSAADFGTAIAVSAAGDAIYLAGGSTSTNIPSVSVSGATPYSFVARFDASGTRQWVRPVRTDSASAQNFNYTTGMALDASGNLILVGSERRYNISAGALETPFAIKLGSDASPQWVYHFGDSGYYNGTTNYWLGHNDAVTTDSAGNVYVVGSWESGSQVSRVGTWSRTAGDRSSDITVTRFTPSGGLSWTTTVASTNGQTDRAPGILVDNANHVFVTGYTAGTLPSLTSQGGYDYFIGRFDATSGTRQWLVQNGTSSQDGGFGLSVDTSQNAVWVIGNSGDVSGTPVAFQNTYFGFLARHALDTGTRVSYQATADYSGVRKGCSAILATGLSSGDGIYTIDPDGVGPLAPVDVYCDMTTDGGGWTLVTRITTPANTDSITMGTQNYPLRTAKGATPITPQTLGVNKLSDDMINALRSTTVLNNLKVVLRMRGYTQQAGPAAYHPRDCVFDSEADQPPSHVCNKSSLGGPNGTNYLQSGHHGMLTRWYIDNNPSYLYPFVHIGPTGVSNWGGHSNPATYCTYYDYRTCGIDSAFEIWAY